MAAVLVLLPPSETKHPGGDSDPLDLATLTAPELTPIRTELVEALVKLADDVPAARAELEAKGVEFQGETFDTGVCHMAFFKDPDGNALILHKRYAPPGARPPGLD